MQEVILCVHERAEAMRRSFYWDRLVIKIICLLELGGGVGGGLCVTLDLNIYNEQSWWD